MKKFIALLLVVALTASVSIAGTTAYLQSEDSDVNVMTLGNVKIAQHEYERVVEENGNYTTKEIDGVTSYVLQDFTQAKPLYPIVGDPNEPGNSPAYAGYDNTIVRMTQVDSYGSMQVFAGKNAQDKFITVENTGKSDAYVRTIVAIEVGATDGTKIMNSARAGDELAPWIANGVGIVSIGGNNYKVVEYVYRGASDVSRHVNGILPAGDTTYPSFCQVYLKHNATNEDMEAIDGNGNGTLDILVLSQAVQTQGFADAKTALDTAFGKPSEKAAEWFGDIKTPILVRNVNDMREAMKIPGGKMILSNDIEITDDKGTGYCLYAKYDCEIDLNGYDLKVDLSGKEFYGVVYALNGAKVDIVGEGNIEINGGVGPFIWCTGGNENAPNGTEVNIYGGNWNQESGDFTSKNYCEGIYANRAGIVNIYGGIFNWNNFQKYTVNESRGGVINIYGGTFINFDPRVSHDSDGSYVAEGYTVIPETQSNGDIWYTVVKAG